MREVLPARHNVQMLYRIACERGASHTRDERAAWQRCIVVCKSAHDNMQRHLEDKVVYHVSHIVWDVTGRCWRMSVANNANGGIDT